MSHCSCSEACVREFHGESAADRSATGPENQDGGLQGQGFESSALRQLAVELVQSLWEEWQPHKMYAIAEDYLKRARSL